jgi:cell division protein FtsN
MTKDYAKPSTTRKPASSKKKPSKAKRTSSRSTQKTATKPKPKTASATKGHAKYVVLMVIIVGLFVYGLFHLASIPPEQLTTESKASEPASTPQKKPKIVEQTKPKKETEARFKFYDLLPNSEVESSTVDAYQFKEKGQNEQYLYLVQTGSFKNMSDAERQKATIAFQGLKARIRTVKNESGSTWHRVETGPFNSRSDMNAALDKLVAINIQPLVKKTKK